ncbi:MAG: hypothetical protein ACOCXQ_00215 [Patescibacteria group bacterium]
MKKRIDLFTKKKQVQPIPTHAVSLRNYGILVLIVSVLFSIGSGVIYYLQLESLDQVNSEIRGLESFISRSDDIQGNIVYFITKKDQLTEYEQNDIHFRTYYLLLTGIIAQSDTTSELTQMTLNQEKETNFIVSIPDFEEGEPLLGFVESEEFLQYFDSLTMNSFTVGTGDRLELRFRGKFAEENNESESGDQS